MRLICEYSKQESSASFSIDKHLDCLTNLNCLPNLIIGSISTSLRTWQSKVHKPTNIIAYNATY